jgi:hypothetical protein
MVTLADLGGVVVVVASESESEVSVGLPSANSSEEPGVLSLRSDLGELVESEHLAAGLDDAATGGGGESEGADGQLRDDHESLVVEYGADNDQYFLALGLGLRVLHQARQRDWEPVRVGLVQALVDDCVELGVGSAGQEAV